MRDFKYVLKMENLSENELPVNKIILGNANEVLKLFPENSIDAVVTDPPYGLKFMNQKWDYDVPSVELWREVYRVLKPGGHLLSFFGTKTYHRGVVNIEDAGFEIRDMIQWLYGSGFPKSMDISKAIDKGFGKLEEREVIGIDRKKGNIGYVDESYKYEPKTRYITAPATPEAKQWQGWGTALKPACEPIVLARKPLSEKNVAKNMLKWGTGALNINACRIKYRNEEDMKSAIKLWNQFKGKIHSEISFIYNTSKWNAPRSGFSASGGRFPANVILDEYAAKMLDEQSGILKSGRARRGSVRKKDEDNLYKLSFAKKDEWTQYTPDSYGDIGGASRFFYVAKAGRNERFAYCLDCDDVIPQTEWKQHKGHKMIYHTTVKPLKLIEYLVKLITPPNGIVLDPFFGTGTTGIASLKQGFKFVGIEIDENYCKIAERRLSPYISQRRFGS